MYECKINQQLGSRDPSVFRIRIKQPVVFYSNKSICRLHSYKVHSNGASLWVQSTSVTWNILWIHMRVQHLSSFNTSLPFENAAFHWSNVFSCRSISTFIQPNCWSISQLFFQRNKIFSCWPIWVQSRVQSRVQHTSFLYGLWRVYLELLNSNLGPRFQDRLHFGLSVEAAPKFTEIFLLTYLSTQLIKWALDLTKTDLFRKKMLIVL